jgi:hypothetical protein
MLVVASVSVNATETVSPGALDRMAQVNNACPTFSWGEEDGAAAYELVAYVLPEDAAQQAELTSETEVLFTSVAGSATSWTPSADQCFAPGGRYVWFVRAVSELVDDQVIEAGEWSAGRYFTVPAAPSAEEMQRALEVLRRWDAANGDGSPTLFTAAATAVPAAVPDADADTDSDAGSAAPKSVPTASAAIRGEHPDTSGEKYGVVGTTASYEGAGVAAVNLEGGPDLVLDGSVNGAADARIYESMLERWSPNDQTFLFHNGGGGLLNIITHGTVTGDAFKVQYGTVIDDAGNWLGVGDTVPCPGCVASSDIADGSVATGDLADNAITSAKIVDGQVRAADLGSDAVTSVKILDGTIAAADLADGSVTGAKIGAGAVDSGQIRAGAVENAQLADNAVTGGKIQDGAVRNADLGSNAVTTDKIADGTVATADLADGAVTAGKLAAGAVTGTGLADGSVTSAKIADGTVATADLANGAVIGTKLADDAVDSAAILDGSITNADIGAGQVSTSHYANWSVTTDKLNLGAVTTSKIADGTITAEDVDPTGGVYASKSAVYEVVQSGSLLDHACSSLTAYCGDANDLGLQGSCLPEVAAEMRVVSWTDVHWTNSTADPAGFTCSVCNDLPVPADYTVRVVCVTVPGP